MAAMTRFEETGVWILTDSPIWRQSRARLRPIRGSCPNSCLLTCDFILDSGPAPGDLDVTVTVTQQPSKFDWRHHEPHPQVSFRRHPRCRHGLGEHRARFGVRRGDHERRRLLPLLELQLIVRVDRENSIPMSHMTPGSRSSGRVDPGWKRSGDLWNAPAVSALSLPGHSYRDFS